MEGDQYDEEDLNTLDPIMFGLQTIDSVTSVTIQIFSYQFNKINEYAPKKEIWRGFTADKADRKKEQAGETNN
jgi:hypothetical protein